MSRFKSALATILLLTISFAPLASAAVARIDFTAAAFLPDGSGDTVEIVGFYLLDTEAQQDSNSGGLASYRFPLIEGQITVGAVSYAVNPDSVFTGLFIRNGADFDEFSLVTSFSLEDGTGVAMDLGLRDSSGTVFDSTDIPEFDFDLSQFDPSVPNGTGSTGFGTSLLPGVQDLTYHQLTSVTYRVVPIPGAAWLFLSALGVMGLRLGRRNA